MQDYLATQTPLERMAVMVNALGGTTVLELLAVTGHVRRFPDQRFRSIGLSRASLRPLDMAGFSITMLPLDEEIESLLDASCDSYCFTHRS